MSDRKNYYLFDRDVMGYRLISYQKNQTPADGAVLYLFGGGMITQPNKLDFKLLERIMQQTGNDLNPKIRNTDRGVFSCQNTQKNLKPR